MNKSTFAEWMKKVDALVWTRAGCSVHDLPDCCFGDWFDDGLTPGSAANEAILCAQE